MSRPLFAKGARAVGKARAETVEIYLLGSFYTRIDDVQHSGSEWRSKKALTLFKYLLTRRGAKVPREVLLELLWPDEEPEVALGRLYTTVHFLRRTLEPNLDRYEQSRFIHTADGQYWWEPDGSGWIDSDAFTKLYDEGVALAENDRAAALRSWQRALALYRGSFLEEEPYADWAMRPREKLAERFVTASLRVADIMAVDNGDVEEAIGVCRRALSHEPYREELYQALIGYLMAGERYTEAVSEYRHLVTMLHDEFGLNPGPKTRALYDEIVRLQGHKIIDNAGSDLVPAEGPLVCDRRTFDAIHNWALRIQARHSTPLSVLRVRLTDEAPARKLDGALQLFAGTLRASDVLCRDGDEIIVQLAHINRAGANIVARRLARIVEEHGPFPFEIDVAMYTAEGETTEQLP